MNLTIRIVVVTLLLAFVSCAKPIEKVKLIDRAGSPDNSVYYCPDGFDYYATFKMCLNPNYAAGPFTPVMTSKCQRYGGGSACAEDNWEANFAVKIRGNAVCPPGTTQEKTTGICFDSTYAYGPFPHILVTQCLNEQSNDETCETLVWPKEFIDVTVPIPTPGPTPPAGNYEELEANFELPAYNAGSQPNLDLWATYYYLPQVTSISGGISLRDISGDPLGPVLSLKNWCYAAMEGSVRVLDNGSGSGVTYNYAGTSSTNTVDCSAYFNWDVSRTKFRIANGPYGDGVRDYILAPFRTIAVDKDVIPYGSIIYIPEARGNTITLPDGSSVTHDGYFFAGDTGGAIQDQHIDVFIGVSEGNPFSWIKSTSSGKFDAYIVDDQNIINALTDRSKL